ncbi:MAG: NFACT RNA binding domain-containing protein [Firmicutes bacterium]|nr:NFACT RNA binding domain-containing protein [Bacillota bacterium]
MAYDGLLLSGLTNELDKELAGGRIDKIQQYSNDDVVLIIRADRANKRLLLSSNKSYPRMHLTTQFVAQSPANPPMFCMLLRKHLEGGRVQRVSQFKRERIVFIDIETYDELGERAVRRLVIEVMGRHSNILLLDRPDGTIIDATTHMSKAANRHREVLPGRPYEYPPHISKADPLYETEKGFLEKRTVDPHTPIHKFLAEHYMGISPFFGKEVLYHRDLLTHVDALGEWRIFADLLQAALDHQQPVILRDKLGHMFAFYVFVPRHVTGELLLCESVNECVDQFYSARAMSDIARAKTANYLRLVRQERDKAVARAQKFSDLLAAGNDAEAWRVAGELLTAYLHEVPRGASTVTLANFYDGEQPLTIELDPAKTPLDNANAYFKRYAKYKKGLAITAEQLSLASEDARYLESVLHELEHCRVDEIPAIEAELREAGFLPTEKVKPRKESGPGKPGKRGGSKAPDKTGPTREKPTFPVYCATDDTPIWVGRNNRENDLITFKTAKKSDLWLHVKNAPGSHVILPVANPTAAAIYDAALLAAHFSQLRDSSKVEVDVVPVRQLWRPNRARPGFTLFEGQETIVVTMDKTRIEALLTTLGKSPRRLMDTAQEEAR